MSAPAFFAFARKRYQLHAYKESGAPPPWTDDPILQQYRFCNVFREDDKVTRWIRPRITFERYGDKLVGAMVIARWFNRISTLELLWPNGNTAKLDDLFSCWAEEPEGWAETMREVLRRESPLVTGAYMIKTPAKKSKLEGILWCLQQFLPSAQTVQAELAGATLQEATEHLSQFPYLGPFMAYEVITDLRHTPVLSGATDILSWANPGPGCARGLCRILGLPLGSLDRHNSKHVLLMQDYMQSLLYLSRQPKFWPRDWPQWEMREVEHTLCEFDKYERARLGEGAPKQRYNWR